MGTHQHSLAKLHRLAKALKIKVVVKDYPGYGAWIPSRNRINLDKDLEGTQLVSTFLHELGHVFDDLTERSKTEKDKIEMAYGKIYKSKITKKQLKIILRHEKNAWKIGRKIAKMLKIKLGTWYESDIKISIDDYKS